MAGDAAEDSGKKDEKSGNQEDDEAGAGHCKYAFEGIFTCIRNERNIKIHCTVAILVVIAGAVLGITPTEWCICLTMFGLVIALELVNTAIESVVDLVTTERKPLAKVAKDTAAGAVLVAAIMAAIVGLIIFVPRIVSL